MIARTVTGIPRPVGSEFRQRVIHAEEHGERHRIPFVVSVVDSLAGPVIEAHKYHSPTALVWTDPSNSYYALEDVLAQARALLDGDGWTIRKVRPCEVEGCDRGLPLWDHDVPNHNRGYECIRCRMRTVEACRICGAPDPGRWTQEVREALLREALCFTCGSWLAKVDKPPQVVGDDFHTYTIRREGFTGGDPSLKGFAGARFVVAFTDGRVVETDDLWAGGQIPEWLRDRFTPNATVTRGKR
jgi:hypothetical protein